MQLTIIKADGAVYKDGISYLKLNLPSIPSDVVALQFNTTTNSGHIEFNSTAPNEDITSLPSWAVECFAAWDEADYLKKNPPAPTPEQLLEKCKFEALDCLKATDWAELSSVIDPTTTPHLLNAADFISYRNIVRQYAINPVVNPVWPVRPNAVWSS